MAVIDIKTSLFQIMAWRQTYDKPLSGPLRILFTDAYAYSARIYASLGMNELNGPEITISAWEIQLCGLVEAKN